MNFRWVRIFSLVWMPLILGILWTGSAAAWWNEGWQYRNKIALNTTSTGADIKENLMDVPILIRLHSGNFAFANAQAEGHDIRFVGSDDTTLLKHHIERYDIIDEMGLIWVKLPRLSAASDQDFIWMYYGNGDAMGGQDSKNTFDTDEAAVFHFGEIEGTPQDLSLYGQTVNYFSAGQGLPSVIGHGINLNGADDRLEIAAAPTLKLDRGLSFSAWVRLHQPQADACLFHANSDNGEMVIGIDDTKIYARVRTIAGKLFETDRSTDLALGQWHHVTITAAPNQRLTLYLDGLEMFYVAITGGLPDFSDAYSVGAAADGSRAMAGDLDEVRLATTVRSGAWARAAFASQGPDGLLYSFGVEETGGGSGLPVFYLGTIMKNITLDGWLVITCLVVLMIVSWVVFLNKAFFVWMAAKENKAFVAYFDQMADPLADASDPQNGYQNSNLFRVYRNGCIAIAAHRSNGALKDHGTTIKVLKTNLERGFIEESKRLNAWLVMLTMAITGGPFLGLLGTVWGVMNTFAAMAEAGEANIMAIAPGVASALSTTVFGLIVAIPALFAYNFLVSRIKTIMADLTVFIDQFALKVENGREVSA